MLPHLHRMGLIVSLSIPKSSLKTRMTHTHQLRRPWNLPFATIQYVPDGVPLDILETDTSTLDCFTIVITDEPDVD